MKKNNKRRVIISSLALIIVFVLAAWLYAPVIFQEGNPIPMLKGIIQLNFTRNKIVRLDMAGDKYLTKSKNGQESLVNLFDQGYEFMISLVRVISLKIKMIIPCLPHIAIILVSIPFGV